MMQREVQHMISRSGQRRLINPPAYRMVGEAVKYWLWLFSVILFSSGFFIFFMFPLFICFVYFYWLFSRIWKAYGYSVKLLHGSTAGLWIVFVLFASPIRGFVGAIFF
jgi:hypothetical protein